MNKPQCLKSTFPIESPENILPIPKVKQTEKRNSRKRGKTAILTESPYKNDLQISLEAAKKNKEEKEKKRKEKNKLTKRQLFIPASKKKRKVQREKEDSTSSEDDPDAKCLYCKKLYSKSNEGWISCLECRKWSHNSCVGVESDDEATHTCKYCSRKKNMNKKKYFC